MFKAVLLGQWHSLSDPELEHALAVRADFLVFCDFDDLELPDHSTLCRYRQSKGIKMAIESKQKGVNCNLLTDTEFTDKLSGNTALNGVPVKVKPAT